MFCLPQVLFWVVFLSWGSGEQGQNLDPLIISSHSLWAKFVLSGKAQRTSCVCIQPMSYRCLPSKISLPSQEHCEGGRWCQSVIPILKISQPRHKEARTNGCQRGVSC